MKEAPSLQTSKPSLAKAKPSLTPLKDISLNSSPLQKKKALPPNPTKPTPTSTKSTTYTPSSTNKSKSKLAISSTRHISKTVLMVKQGKDSCGNSERVCLVGERFRNLSGETQRSKQFRLVESAEINNFSCIENPSYFPSTKSSKTQC